MRKYNTALFDLDGTLTDSSLGITRCAALALDHYGIAYESLDALRVFIGPPLRRTFPQWGVPEEEVDHAVEIFRGRYKSVGKFENIPYEGIAELLQKLKDEGMKLLVATSKPEEVAVQVLEKFDLAKYFDRICGATMDSSRESKEAVIAYLLEQEKEECRPVMIGDTEFDVTGAAVHSIPAIGVSWGFGSRESMEKAGAVAIADTCDELYTLLMQEK